MLRIDNKANSVQLQLQLPTGTELGKSEKGMKIHMGKMHEIKCKTCNEKFAGESKLKSHMCRLHIGNPSNDTLYMKEWYIKNSCIRVFSNELKKQVALLHSRNCGDNDHCSDYPTNMRYRTRVDDENGLIHLHGETYFERKSGNVEWEFLNFHIFETGHDD